MTTAVATALTITYSALEIAGDPADRIDRKNRVIRGVKIIGLQSVNKGRLLGLSRREFGAAVDRPYRYTISALEEAMPLYEGVKVYIDHLSYRTDQTTGARIIEDRDRSIDEQFGWLSNVRVMEDGLYGDLEYLETNALTAQVLETISRQPNQLALSHHSFLKPKLIGGEVVIVGIGDVKSVDLIGQEPGTTSGMFESKSTPTKGRTMKISPRRVLETVPRKTDGYRALKAVIEMGHEDENDVLRDASNRDMEFEESEHQDDEPAVDHKAQVKEALKAMVAAVFDDESLDAAATLAKIKDILAAQEKLMGTDKPATEADHEDDEEKKKALEAGHEDDDKAAKEKAAQESKVRTKAAETAMRLRVLERRDVARDDLEREGLKPDAFEVRTFAAIESIADQDAFIDMLKERSKKSEAQESRHISPRSHSPHDSEGNNEKQRAPDGKGLALLVR